MSTLDEDFDRKTLESKPSATREITKTDLKVKFEGNIYNTRVLDTIGVCGVEITDNKRIVREIRDRATQLLQDSKLNLILFVFRQGRWVNDDKVSFEKIARVFDKEQL